MKKEIFTLSLTNEMMQWIKVRLGIMNKDDEYNDHYLDCKLVRSLSDYRESELSKVKLSDEFNQKLFEQISNAEIEKPTVQDKIKGSVLFNPVLRNVVYALIPLALIGYGSYYYSISNSNPAISASSKIQVDLNQKIANVDQEDPMDIIIDTLESAADNLEALELLKNYYIQHGDEEKANFIEIIIEDKLTK